MNGVAGLHPSSEQLELLALGRLEDDQSAAIEAHVATCAECGAALAQAPADSFIRTLRDTCQALDTDFPNVCASTLSASLPTDKAPNTICWTRTGRPATGIPATLMDHPRYRLVRKLGQGGMGEVWLAEHKVMNRPVALKLISPEFLDRTGAAERFQREVESAARLHHPNIVTAFDAEQVDGTPLLAMEYVEGRTLSEEMRMRGSLPVAEACEFICQTALGLQHAHEKGLVHRDLKPQNLMRTSTGTVKILDFGLAFLYGAGAAQGGLTGVNMVVGTPDYIAPEQAEDSRSADCRSDIYSLGCTLYHLLTGRVPFPTESVLRKLDAHRTRQAEPLGRLRPDAPEELAKVVAKMMAKRPADRYESAAAVVAALAPFSTGSVRTRRRRSRLVAGLMALLLTCAVIAAGVVYYVVTDHGTIEIVTEDKNVKVVAERKGAQVTILDAKSKQGWIVDTGDWTVRLDGTEEGLKIDLPNSFTLRRGDRHVVTIRKVKRPSEKELDPPVRPTRENAEADLVWTAKQTTAMHDVAISSNGEWVATTSGGSFHNPGWTHVPDNVVRVWDAKTGKEVRRLTGIVGGGSKGLAFHADGKLLAAGSEDGRVLIWNVASGAVVKELCGHRGQIRTVAFSPKDTFLASGSAADQTVRVWNWKTGKEVRKLAIPGSAETLAFTPDGRFLLATSWSAEKSVTYQWDAATWQEVRQIADRWVYGIAPDGRAIGTMPDKTFGFWKLEEVPSRKGSLGPFDGEPSIRALAVHGGGWLTGDEDGRLRLWDYSTGKKRIEFKGHDSWVSGLAFSSNGRFAFSSGLDGVLRKWRLPESVAVDKVGEIGRIIFPGGMIYTVDISPDGQYVLATGGRAHDAIRVKKLDLHSGQVLLDFPGGYVVRFANEGKWILNGTADGQVKILDAKTGVVQREFHVGDLWNASILPGGKKAFFISEYNHEQIRDLETGKKLHQWRGDPNKFRCVVPRGGKHFLYALNGEPYHALNLETGKEERVYEKIVDKRIRDILPDDRCAAWDEKSLFILESSTGKEVRRHDISRFQKNLVEFAFSPDYRRYLAAYQDDSVVLWDIVTGKELWRVAAPDGHLLKRYLRFSPDGRYAVGGTEHGVLYLWRLPEPGLDP